MTTLFLLIIAFVAGMVVGNRYLPEGMVNQWYAWGVAIIAAVGSFAEQIVGMFKGG